MNAWWRRGNASTNLSPPWDAKAPVREELFGPERLEQHTQILALAQPITSRPPDVLPLHQRLHDNTVALKKAYRSIANEVAHRRSVVPAAEWLLDHYHHVEKHVSDIVEDLPPGYYRQLPKLADGPFSGYPRVFGLTWAYVAHTDSHFDPHTLPRFIEAYQRVEPLTIGELWAIAISLRLVLVENLRRLSDQIVRAREARAEADALCEQLLHPGASNALLQAYAHLDIDDPFAAQFYAQLAKRLRDQDPGKTPALAWLEQEFTRLGTSASAVVQNAHQRQGASNVSVRNTITSLPLIADFDWATQVEQVSLVDQRLRAGSRFAEMDFATRDRYRNAIEQLARGSQRDELFVTEQALSAARAQPPANCPPAEAQRRSDPGYYLIADGRRDLERTLEFHPPLRLRIHRAVLATGLTGYAGATVVLTLLLLGLAEWALSATGLPLLWQLPWLLTILLPAYEVATTLVNRALGSRLGGEALPGLALEDGVPTALRTLVAVPAMLTEAVALRELVERLEVHYLSGSNGLSGSDGFSGHDCLADHESLSANGSDLTFALLLDGRDADTAELASDDILLSIAIDAMASLNRRHGPGPAGPRFLLLYRHRIYNASEGCWMGWERKRGKLTELNRLLRGADDTSYIAIDGHAPWVPSGVRYVVTLDSDTRLPRDTIARLVGKMAHPLNQPVFGDNDRVVRGHAILQPRVTPSLPIGRQGSRYQRLFSAPGGMDVYTAAVSDLYQDLFGEGSFAGKGIYAVDAYERALHGRIPENSLLSHDLLEGIFARAGLASDVEVVEAYPERYDVAARRQHRGEIPASPQRPAVAPSSRPPLGDLTFFNGSGGFDHDGREYVCLLDDGATTPQPWINVIANAGFGFQVSAEGSGYTWADNSRENQLTPWSNDPVSDLPGEVIYVQDADSGDLTTVTAHPRRADSRLDDPEHQARHIARHGFGYTRFEHDTAELSMTLLQYVPLNDPIKISRLTLENRTAQPRRLIVTAYTAWVMGTSRARTAPFLVSQHDTATGALMMRNPWNQAFPGRIGFVDLDGRQSGWTADRREFLGRGSLAAPEALIERRPLAASDGAGHDPCTVQQCELTLAPGESMELVAFMGQASDDAAARELIERYRRSDLDAKLSEVETYWRTLHGTLQVNTPDPAMNLMLNGWLMYQTLACRVVARSAFYQASGAYGFRDQLQDGMALTLAMPALARHHLLRATGRQFVEGDVQHWWLPHSGQGVRTHISDDRVWLAFATATYIKTMDDPEVLDERVGFLEGAPLAPETHDDFAQPLVADETASLFEHCARALDQALGQFGEHGLPLIGTGDWNDGFNRIGEAGRGESVWLGWLLLRTLALFAPLAEARNTPEARARAERWRERAEALRLALESEAWDGEWYRRATFDDGQWLGTRDNDACRIDAIAQSWAVLSEGADPERAAQAMASVERHLIRPQERLALLFTPAFDQTALEPGYIKGYPPGLRENGGQYTHAAMWSILAFVKLGQADRAYRLFSLLNPINHALTPDAVERYRVEPYVIAADVFSEPPHVGRGGWTWYTGSAGWMYQAGVGGILGIRREGRQLIVSPCIPDAWPSELFGYRQSGGQRLHDPGRAG